MVVFFTEAYIQQVALSMTDLLHSQLLTQHSCGNLRIQTNIQVQLMQTSGLTPKNQTSFRVMYIT